MPKANSKAAAKNTRQPTNDAPAADKTQEHAAAGEAQAERTPTVAALLVTAKKEGFRRAGRAWSRTETRVEIAELTDDQVEALFAEPMLDVVGVAE